MSLTQGVVASFEDKYGETRKIHKTRHGLALKRQTDTVIFRFTRPIGLLIGARIRARREALGLSLAGLCLRAGMSSTTPKSRMWEIENATRNDGIRFATLYAIAIALECQPFDLMPTTQEVLELSGIRQSVQIVTDSTVAAIKYGYEL